jgi:DNA invertase Pin-like site-specific DNA recombinase
VIGARSACDPHVRDQARVVLEAARRRGWPRPAVYTEIGLPGWHRPRSALGRLAGHLASGRHDAVIVADLSRIGRDPADVLAFTVHCARCGVTIEAVEEGLIDEPRLSALYARQPVVTA